MTLTGWIKATGYVRAGVAWANEVLSCNSHDKVTLVNAWTTVKQWFSFHDYHSNRQLALIRTSSTLSTLLSIVMNAVTWESRAVLISTLFLTVWDTINVDQVAYKISAQCNAVHEACTVQFRSTGTFKFHCIGQSQFLQDSIIKILQEAY